MSGGDAAGPVMRALRAHAPGEPASLLLEEVPRPVPGPGEALVRVTAAAVNRSDCLTCRGIIPGPFPRVLGRDYAGVVELGPSAWVGRRVWGTSGGDLGIGRDGTHAQFVTVPAEALTATPETFTDVQAAASGLAYFTAATALDRLGAVRPGDVVLATGAAGGVGGAVLRVAAFRGAVTVGVVLDEREAEVASSAGVDAVVRSDLGDVAGHAVEAAGGGGVRLAVDVVGGALTAQVLAATAVGGAVCILSSAPGAHGVDLLDFYRKGLRMEGLNTSLLTAVHAAAALQSLAEGFAGGALPPAPVHAVHSLDQAAAAYADVERGVPGRPVLVPD